MLQGPIRRIDGFWQIPDASGLGVEIDEDEAGRHPFRQEALTATDAVLADGTVVGRCGSRPVFRYPDRSGHVVVPHPKKDVGAGLIAAIRKQAGLQEGRSRVTPSRSNPAPGRRRLVLLPDTLDEALAGAEEAAAAWIDAALDAGDAIPGPSSLETVHRNPDDAGWIFGAVTLDPALLDDSIERVNITLPRRVLKRLDALARAAGESRSGCVAHLTRQEPRRIA